jgi:hypothetical protein
MKAEIPIRVSQHLKAGDAFYLKPSDVVPDCPNGLIIIGEGTNFEDIIAELNFTESDAGFLAEVGVKWREEKKQ